MKHTGIRALAFSTVFFLSAQGVFASTTYTFNADTVGQAPANMTATTGTIQVANDATLGKSINATVKSGEIAGALFDLFPSTADYSIVWKENYAVDTGHDGMILRAQSSGTTLAGHTGARQGYLFQVYDSSNVYIWKVTSAGFVNLYSGTLAKVSPRYYRASAVGSTLTFEYSSDGTNFTTIGTATDTTYTSGLTEYTAGYGVNVGSDFVDDVSYTNLGLDLTGSTSLAATTNIALPITDLQISGNTATTTPVKLFVTNGTLAMSTMTGLTFTGGTTGSVLYFSGTVANINAALATLTYTRTSTGTDTLEVSLVNSGEVFFSSNGHLYKFITGSTDWNTAYTAAAAQTAYGAAGYLATITSQSENDFISGRIVADGWIGASDSAVEGDWKWVTGPETGTSFWSGASGGSAVGGAYSYWNNGEPNNAGNEDCAEYYSGSGRWNDLPCSGNTLSGYMVEFGTPSGLPAVVARNVAITTEALPAISSTTPADNATNIVPSANLSIVFNKTIQVGTGNIVIKKTSDNSTVQTIDVTSGQVTGSGTNTITIDPTADLSYNTSYYIQIGSTAFHDTGNNNFAGIADTTTWNFTTQTAYTLDYIAGANGSITGTTSQIIVTGGNGIAVTAVPSTGYTFINWSDESTANPRTDTSILANLAVTANFADITAPTISTTTATPSRYGATISWNTDESTSSFVVYGTSPSYGSTTAEADISPRASSHIVTLAGLTCNTTYYANPKSNDASANLGVGTGISFTTLQCPHSGGGGAVTPKAIQVSPEGTTTKLDFIINNGEKNIANNILTIHLNGDPTKVSGYAISLSPTFNNTGIRPLPINNTDTYTLPNNYGTYTIYMQYYSTSGHTSPLISHMVTYMPGVENSVPSNISAAGSVIPDFKSTLKYGSKGTDVRTLQQFLNTHGAPVVLSGPGSLGKESNIFSKKVIAAVKAYQKQKGIKPANGVVGPKTKAIMMMDTK